MFWFFGHQVWGILALRPGIEPAPPALEDELLTTEPPGKSPQEFLPKILIEHVLCDIQALFKIPGIYL